MKIAFLAEGNETYGVSRLTISLARELIREGHESCVFHFVDGPLIEQAMQCGIATSRCSGPPPPNYGAGLGQAISKALALTRNLITASTSVAQSFAEYGPDAVVVRMPNLVPIGAIAAHKANTSSFWIMPNLVSDRYPLNINKWIYELLFWKYGMTPVANSKFTAGTLLGISKKVEVLHLGIDPQEFSSENTPSINRETLGYKQSDIVVGIFARLVPEKGQAEMIEALALDSSLSNVRLMICGGPLETPYHQYLKERAQQLEVDQQVQFLGPINDPRPYYQACDLVANSRIDPEPFGLSVIEAMMMGRPVLAHSLGGPGETILDGETGWLVHEPTPASFARGLIAAVGARDRWNVIGATAQKHARATFSIARVTRDLTKLIETAQ